MGSRYVVFMKLISPCVSGIAVLPPLRDFALHRDPNVVVVDGGNEEENHDNDSDKKALVATDMDHGYEEDAVTRQTPCKRPLEPCLT